jgi:dethiobiotin synthetase
VTPLKAIETGCGPDLRALDAEALARAAGTDPARACLRRFVPPVCPQAAAEQAGETIELAPLLRAAQALPGTRLLVEGAGGLLVPIAPHCTMADLGAGLSAQVLIVARSRLGTINHTLLTLSECRRRGLSVLGVILCRAEAALAPDEADNGRLIEAHGGAAVLGTLPHCPAAEGPAGPASNEVGEAGDEAGDAALAALAASHLDLDGLWLRWGALADR